MAAVVEKNTFSEDQFGKKVDRCITDTLVKAGRFPNSHNNVNKFFFS